MIEDLTDTQARWLYETIKKRERGVVVHWSAVPKDVRSFLSSRGFIWRYDGTVEVALAGVRALKRWAAP
jgi:hypothetical protein